MIKVSVCIPSYNSEKYIKQAIQSVFLQNYKDYEIVIVDDGSCDSTQQIIENYANNDKRITFHKNEVNLGIVGNFNKCLEFCRGEFVKFLLADDVFLSPDCLGRFVDLLESHPDVSLVSSGRKLIDSNSRGIGEAVCYEEGLYSPGSEIIKDCLLYLKNRIGEPTSVLFRKELLSRGFDENYEQLLDLEMWFYLLEKGDFFYIKDCLVGFRVHPEQATQKNKQNLTYLNDFCLLLNDYCHKKYIKFSKIKKKIGLLKHFDKIYKLYKNGKLKFHDMKTLIEGYMPFAVFLFLRPFYKISKNIIRIKYLR
jgi:glycosyltransferase involved in cell wall biosynthesis